MSVKNIVLAGNPALRQPAKIVAQSWFNSNESRVHIDDLFETLKNRMGAGLSAIQIGIPLRIIVYGFSHNLRYPDQAAVPYTLMVNPTIIESSKDKIALYEGCLSLPELRGLVPRHQSIRVKAQDSQGQWFEKTFSGFEARIIQHEIDHLDGKLFPERMEDLQSLGITSALREANTIA